MCKRVRLVTRSQGGSSPRFAHALSGWAILLDLIQVASAAGRWFSANLTKRFRIARYCAMLCSYASAGAWSERRRGDVRVKRRALKARNVCYVVHEECSPYGKGNGNTAYISQVRHPHQQESGGVRVKQGALKARNVSRMVAMAHTTRSRTS